MMSLLASICPQPEGRFVVQAIGAKENIAPTAMAFYFQILQQTEQSKPQSAILVSKQTVLKQTYTNIQDSSSAQCTIWSPAL